MTCSAGPRAAGHQRLMFVRVNYSSSTSFAEWELNVCREAWIKLKLKTDTLQIVMAASCLQPVVTPWNWVSECVWHTEITNVTFLFYKLCSKHRKSECRAVCLIRLNCVFDMYKIWEVDLQDGYKAEALHSKSHNFTNQTPGIFFGISYVSRNQKNVANQCFKNLLIVNISK